jgi:hypothetical protein
MDSNLAFMTAAKVCHDSCPKVDVMNFETMAGQRPFTARAVIVRRSGAVALGGLCQAKNLPIYESKHLIDMILDATKNGNIDQSEGM